MKEDVLVKLLGSQSPVKIMRVLFANPHKSFRPEEIRSSSRAKADQVRLWLKRLENSGLVKVRSDKKSKTKKLYQVNTSHELYHETRTLVLATNSLDTKGLKQRFKSVGNVSLLVTCGKLVPRSTSDIDLLVVTNKGDEKKITKAVSEISSNTGYELSYAVLSVDDFNYRRGMNDRLLRDIFDFAYEIHIDKLGLDF